MDNNATNHSYPRPTDPASQSTAELNNGILAVSSVTTNTFTVNVGPAGDETFKCTNVKSAISILLIFLQMQLVLLVEIIHGQVVLLLMLSQVVVTMHIRLSLHLLTQL